MTDPCKCTDPGCPVHPGVSSCPAGATVTLYRVDMADQTGTRFCDACAADALKAGVFTDGEDGDDDDDDDEPEDDTPTEPDEDDITTTDHRTFYQSGKKVLERHRRTYDWFYYPSATREATRAQQSNHSYAAMLELAQTSGRVVRTRDNQWLGAFGDDHKAALRAYMARVQFWPNCWFISDHGNAHLMDLTKEGT